MNLTLDMDGNKKKKMLIVKNLQGNGGRKVGAKLRLKFLVKLLSLKQKNKKNEIKRQQQAEIRSKYRERREKRIKKNLSWLKDMYGISDDEEEKEEEFETQKKTYPPTRGFIPEPIPNIITSTNSKVSVKTILETVSTTIQDGKRLSDSNKTEIVAGLPLSNTTVMGSTEELGGSSQSQSKAEGTTNEITICHLCSRQFLSEEKFRRHETQSELHQQNLLAQFNASFV
jgi:ATPase subunit of ABC transporter with duplicated ATPase domains